MAKYRGVLLVPTVIEFESDGSEKHVTEQALRVARGMGKADSLKMPMPLRAEAHGGLHHRGGTPPSGTKCHLHTRLRLT